MSSRDKRGIDLRLRTRVTAIDPAREGRSAATARRAAVALGYDALVVATGADPVRPPVPGTRA